MPPESEHESEVLSVALARRVRNFEVPSPNSRYLAQGDAPIVRRDALMPIRTEPLGLQPLDGPFGQITVLEAATGKGHSVRADMASNRDYGFGQGVMEPGGDLGNRDLFPDVLQNRPYQRVPIHQERDLRGAGLRIEWHDRQRIGVMGFHIRGQCELQFHRGLAFKTNHLP